MTQFQEILLETFKAFKKICEEHNITYYAAFGTALGAFRHKGFIPWDDDLDVVMKRKDYDYFIEISKDLQSRSNYKVSHIFDGEYPNVFAKFYCTDYTIWEYRKFPIIIGPWIDIFPIDIDSYSKPNSNLFDAIASTRWKYMKSLARITWKEIGYDLFHERILNVPIKIGKKTILPFFKRHYLKKLDKLFNQVRQIKDGDCYIRYGWWPKQYCRECFDNKPISMPFENTTINVPFNCEKHLEEVFGQDYMTPPPIDKQVSHHNIFFMNLEKKMTIEDILEEMGDVYGTDAKITISSLIRGYKGRNRV